MKKLPYECVALVLQGGGALGAYQAGVFEGLVEAGVECDWIAGISIGAINAALIAGNAHGDRVERLREFWTTVTAPPLWPATPPWWPTVDGAPSEHARGAVGWFGATRALVEGQRVRVTEGPFGGLEAIFKARSGAERVILLVRLLGEICRVEVPLQHLAVRL